jgi:hypothetical protein
MPDPPASAHQPTQPAGLDPDSDTIIEVACLITDGELEHVIEARSCPSRLASLASVRPLLAPGGARSCCSRRR